LLHPARHDGLSNSVDRIDCLVLGPFGNRENVVALNQDFGGKRAFLRIAQERNSHPNRFERSRHDTHALSVIAGRPHRHRDRSALGRQTGRGSTT
jgi:hypothetical protein